MEGGLGCVRHRWASGGLAILVAVSEDVVNPGTGHTQQDGRAARTHHQDRPLQPDRLGAARVGTVEQPGWPECSQPPRAACTGERGLTYLETAGLGVPAWLCVLQVQRSPGGPATPAFGKRLTLVGGGGQVRVRATACGVAQGDNWGERERWAREIGGRSLSTGEGSDDRW